MSDQSGDVTITGHTATPQTFASGRYVVRRILGEGSQKIVYLVNDEVIGRECALSLLRSGVLGDDAVQRFRREAHAMAGLGTQANVVAVFDTGEENDRPFLVCEYVSGGDLRRMLYEAAQPLDLDRAAAIAADLACALALAHGQGIIHRDVKPGNVWLTDQGVAKLGDFGLATTLDASQLTMAGTVMGTAAYMSPEQALGGEVDARSDLYALGAVLYEMVTARPPFLGDDALAVISQHINTAPVAPSWHNPAILPAFNLLILRLLAKAPGERPDSAETVGDELNRIREGGPGESALWVSGNDLQGLAWGNFVGRRRELDQMKIALDKALSGRGSVVMIVGEPGIGKTRIAQEFSVYAGLRGARVVTGQCYEEASAPYGPFVEAFRQYASGLEDEALREQLGEGAPEIGMLLPEVRRRLPDVHEAPPLEAEGERLRLFDSVTTFVKAASTAKPLLVLIEDLHWADPVSLLLLQYLARGIAGKRVLIVGTYRDIEIDGAHPLAETVVALARQQNHRQLPLSGLSEADVEELLDAIEPSGEIRAGRHALAAALHQETEGNPFFMREVLSSLVEEGKLYRESGRWRSNVSDVSDLGIPRSVREVIGRRLSRLGDACRNLLTTASALTGPFSWEELDATSEEEEAVLLDLLDEALAAQLIFERKVDEAGEYDFTHALIRQALYESISTPRRVLLHRRIGEALERLYESNLEPHLSDLAYHFSRGIRGGSSDSRAVSYAVQAAEKALSQTAYEEAARMYEMAIAAVGSETPQIDRQRCKLLLAHGGALMRAGELDRARKSLLSAAEVARAGGDAGALCRAALEYAGRGVEAVDYDPQRFRLLEEALEALGDTEPSMRVQLLALQSRDLSASPDAEVRERGEALSLRALDDARGLNDAEALFLALDARYWALFNGPNIKERLAISTETVDVASQLPDKSTGYWARDNRSIDLLQVGDMRALRLEVEAMDELARDLRQPSMSLNLTGIRSMLAFLEGRLDEGDALFAGTLDTTAQLGGAGLAQNYQATVAPCELRGDRRQLEEMETAIKAMIALGGGLEAGNRCRLAYFYCELGLYDEAHEAIDALSSAQLSELGSSNLQFTSCMFARVTAHLGQRDRSQAKYATLLPFAGSNAGNANQSYIGPVSRYLGLLATTLSRWEDAESHFQDAMEMTRRMGARPWTAISQYDYAQMLVMRDRSGDRERARVLLDDAIDMAQELGLRLEAKAKDLRADIG